MKEGWETKKLGDVCDFEGGSQPPKSQFIYEPKPGFVRFLQIRDFGSDKNITYIPESKKNRRCEDTDILIGRYGASVGKILTGKAGAYNVALMKTIPDLSLLKREWFHSYLLSAEFQDRLMNVASRSAQDGFSKEDIFNFPIPVPPLPEQQRIVQILDEAFAAIATAKASAEKNLKNARALFESYLEAVFSQRGEGWEERPLEYISIILNGYAFKSTDFSPKSSVKCIKITNVGIREFVAESGSYLPASFSKEYSVVAIKAGSIVIALTRTIIAGGLKVAIVPKEYDGALLNQRVAAIQANDAVLGSDFLFAYLSTQAVADYVTQHVNTLMQPNLSIADLRSLPVPLPPRREQKEITAHLDNLRSESQRLESIYKRKLVALDELKKSLLHQAFTGVL